MVDNLKYWVQQIVPLVYDDSLSLYELVNKVATKLNELIDQSNTYFSQDLKTYLTQILTEWQADGTFTSIIEGSVFTDFSTRLTSVESKASANETNIQTNSTGIQTNAADILDIKTKLPFATPEHYGAKGDGVTDDTAAIQQCLDENMLTVFACKTYKITTSLKLPIGHSIEGYSARILVAGNWTPNTFGASVPPNVMLWVQGGTHPDFDFKTKFLHNLRLEGDSSLELTGIYYGVPDRALMTGVTAVSDAVFGFHTQNVSLNKLYDGMLIGEMWESAFDYVQTSYIRNISCNIKGQSVNLYFTKVDFNNVQMGTYALNIDGNTYNSDNSFKRPEGLTFNGGFIGSSAVGIHVQSALSVTFNNLIIDLNSQGAQIADGSYITFTDCWFSASSMNGITLLDQYDASSGLQVIVRGCKIVVANPNMNAIYTGLNCSGLIVDGCFFDNTITFNSGSKGIVKNNICVTPETTNPTIIKNGCTVITQDNVYKASLNPVVVQ
jgi:hypothetical protein